VQSKHLNPIPMGVGIFEVVAKSRSSAAFFKPSTPRRTLSTTSMSLRWPSHYRLGRDSAAGRGRPISLPPNLPIASQRLLGGIIGIRVDWGEADSLPIDPLGGVGGIGRLPFRVPSRPILFDRAKGFPASAPPTHVEITNASGLTKAVRARNALRATPAPLAPVPCISGPPQRLQRPRKLVQQRSNARGPSAYRRRCPAPRAVCEIFRSYVAMTTRPSRHSTKAAEEALDVSAPRHLGNPTLHQPPAIGAD
jgi:hypothetical protein